MDHGCPRFGLLYCIRSFITALNSLVCPFPETKTATTTTTSPRDGGRSQLTTLAIYDLGILQRRFATARFRVWMPQSIVGVCKTMTTPLMSLFAQYHAFVRFCRSIQREQTFAACFNVTMSKILPCIQAFYLLVFM